MTDDSEGSLVLRLRRGDPDAAEALLARYREPLRRFCRAYLAEDAVEDALQEVVIKVLRAPAAPERLRPWLYRIARNHCLNAARGEHRRRDKDRLASDAEIVVSATGPLTSLQRRESAAELARRLETLDDGDRELLRLRYGEGFSRGEVAEVMGLPEPLVKSRLYEAVKRLRHSVG
jgi:RNA polymerase sigma-70 factor, ECF subfamily